MDQQSDAWFAARIGLITASRIKDVIAKTKSGYSTSRANYAAQLMLERATGVREEGFTNAAMLRGVEEEPFARAAYEVQMNVMVDEVGFIPHPTIARSGASPDGLVGADGMVEIKNGNTATHCKWAIAGKVPEEHIPQLVWQLACSGRQYVDFVSYDRRMPEGQQLFIRRFHREEKLIAEITGEVLAFDREVDDLVANLGVVKWT